MKLKKEKKSFNKRKRDLSLVIATRSVYGSRRTKKIFGLFFFLDHHLVENQEEFNLTQPQTINILV